MNNVEQFWLDFLKSHKMSEDTRYSGELSFETTDPASVEELALILGGKKKPQLLHWQHLSSTTKNCLLQAIFMF